MGQAKEKEKLVLHNCDVNFYAESNFRLKTSQDSRLGHKKIKKRHFDGKSWRVGNF